MAAKFVPDEINRQRRLSEQVTNVVLDALMDIYYPGLSRDEIRLPKFEALFTFTSPPPSRDELARDDHANHWVPVSCLDKGNSL